MYCLILIIIGLFGCEEQREIKGLKEIPGPLVKADQWMTVDALDDPLPSHRPPMFTCSSDGVFIEAGILEIDTGRCSYFAVKQELPIALKAGDQLAITLYHDALYAEHRSEAHIAILIEREIVWENRIPIPSAPRLMTEHFRVPSSVPVGGRIDFHLHNHGLNHWRLASIEIQH